MAKNDRDRLIQTFMARNRNRRLPGLRTTTPQVTKSNFRPQKGKAGGLSGYRLPTGGENAVFSRRAEDDGPDTRTIPGFGGVRQVRESRRAQALKRPVPGSYQPGRRGQTKPTPGSYYGRKKPRLN